MVSMLAIHTVLLTGCGSDTRYQAELEPATLPGLAAAAYSRFDSQLVGRTSGTHNDSEEWMSVSASVGAPGKPVRLDIFVARPRESTPSDPCADSGYWILSCQSTTADDGSPLFIIASTEDLTGGESTRGFFVFVGHERDDEVVLVIETLESRKKSYVDLSGLPVDLRILKEIATDPLVGFRTSPEMNRTGAETPQFSRF